MKKIFLLTFVFIFTFSTYVFAQEVRIIELKGKVQVRKNAASEWAKAEAGQLLNEKSEIKTGLRGECVISFDAKNSNIITLKRNTSTVIEDIKPGGVFLKKGRVFTIIRDLEQIENFEVRTPTAAAGARGTGWVTEFTGGITSISVFEDDVFVVGFNEQGDIVSTFDIREDFAVAVERGGQYGDLEPIEPEDREEWGAVAKTMEEFIGAPRMDDPNRPRGDYPPPMPGGPGEDMHLLLERMKESGEYSDQEILEFMQMLEGGMDNMNPENMFAMMEVMGDMNMLTPEEQAMMSELRDNEEALMAMSPQERETYIREMEDKYGVEHFEHDGYMEPRDSGTYVAPDGTVHEPTPEEMAMHEELMANEQAIMEMSPEERDVYMREMEERYGLEPYQTDLSPDGQQHTSGDSREFDQYMGQYNTPPPDGGFYHGDGEGEYQYRDDQYFGEFDHAWNDEGGYWVDGVFHEHQDEYFDDIHDMPCPCYWDCSIVPPPPDYHCPPDPNM